jgi:DNA-binding transcriptional ArsR family regulator
MICIHFTPADLGKITFQPAPNALLETMTSVHRLLRWRAGRASALPGTRRWHREVGSSLEDRLGVLLELLPRRPGDWMPDFLTEPIFGDINEAAELVGQTPSRQLAEDISRLAPPQRACRWVRELADGATKARQALANDIQSYFSSSLTSVWPQIQAYAVNDRALRSETLLRGGVDALFATFGTGWRWEPPTLHVPAPFTQDISLDGHGLLLIPSYFAVGPVTAAGRPDGPKILIYPMRFDDRWVGDADDLGPLLGHTRAAVLAALCIPATTSALAARAGISLSSASQHTAALRNAGLVSTTRQGISVRHTLTPLGAALLRTTTSSA